MSFTNPIELPHIDWPARLGPDGKFVTVEQNSPADVAACVTRAVACPPGALLGNPTFGVPSALFQTMPVNVAPILAAVQRIEPRATSLSADVLLDAVNAGITLRLGVGVVDTSFVQSSDGS